MVTATELTARFRSGNKDALFSMMSLYYNDLFRYGLKFTADKDLTKDIIGQFFLHIWDHRENFFAAENLAGYVMVSYKHFLTNYLHRISRQLNIPNYETDLVEYSYEEYIIACQDEENRRKILFAIIQTLPERQKQLVQFRYYEQLSIEEIARRTSLSVRTVYNKLHEAIKKIRAALATEEIRKRFY
jgi:RNA polymerase sigma factor (sigma-70 family)